MALENKLRITVGQSLRLPFFILARWVSHFAKVSEMDKLSE